MWTSIKKYTGQKKNNLSIVLQGKLILMSGDRQMWSKNNTFGQQRAPQEPKRNLQQRVNILTTESRRTSSFSFIY